MGERVHVMVASGSVDQLRVPPLAITDGGTDLEWIEVAARSWLFGRGTPMRLPLDPASAARFRRHRRTTPVTMILLAVMLLAWLATFGDIGELDHPVWIWVYLAALLGWVTWMRHVNRLRVEQLPTRTAGHLVRLSGLPRPVAALWARENPETVRILERRVTLRRFRPSVYVISGVACLGVGGAMFVIAKDVLGLVFVSVGLLVAGGVLLFKSLPPRFIRFEPVE